MKKKELKKILGKEVYRKFKKNFKNENEERLKEYLEGVDNRSIICAAFFWHDTPEGTSFWSVQDEVLIDYMNKNLEM